MCWGDNEHGQATPPGGTFVAIAAGGNYSCGIRTDQSIVCWGGEDGEPAEPPDGTFTHVAAGYGHSCGIRTDGTLACWGAEYVYDVAPGPAPSDADAASGGPLGDKKLRWEGVPSGTFTAIAAGFDYSCGIRIYGTLACWLTPAWRAAPAGVELIASPDIVRAN